MLEKNCIQKVCSFYVSNMHFATMILPYLNKQIKENNNIITFFESNYTTNVELVLSKLTIKEEDKKELLEIKWKNTNGINCFNIEKIIKTKIKKNKKNIIIVNGCEEYINGVNYLINKLIEKNNRLELNKIKIIDFYDVEHFNDNIKEILDNHQAIFNTSGEHNIEDIFEGYKKEEEKVIN